jgi:hypothetical protein
LSGPVLPAILRERHGGGERDGNSSGENTKRQTYPGHTIPLTQLDTQRTGLALGREHYKNKMAIKGARN